MTERVEIFEEDKWPYERIQCVCDNVTGAPKPRTECKKCGAHWTRDGDEAVMIAGPIGE